MTFDEFDLSADVLDGIDSMNYDEATPIQELAIPPLLEGRDLLGIAQTGTGKTAAYLLPIINRIYEGEFHGDNLKAVVVVPTRELAQQIDKQIQGFGYFVSISSLAIYGGTDGIVWEQQKRSIQKGADIIVATPGRLLDLLNNGDASIATAHYFVIDEADRMLDMGFLDDIMLIRKALPKQCQTALFSATMPDKILALVHTLLNDPVKIEIAISRPPERIMQCAYICYEHQKMGVIASIYKDQTDNPKRTVIFASSKQKVKELITKLKQLHLKVGEMHSDLTQLERDQVMRDFKVGYIKILVATNIVSRGIDIDDIEVVINYDLPRDNEDYVHRIGRTARGDSQVNGLAITLVSEDEIGKFNHLQTFLGKTIQCLPVEASLGEVPDYEFVPHQPSSGKRHKGRRYRSSRRGKTGKKEHTSKPANKRSDNSQRKTINKKK